MNASKKRLGRGLAALIGDDYEEEALAQVANESGGLKSIAVADILPSPFNPRQHFDEAALQELAQSIREKGLLQPILVRPAGEGRYEIVAGERRWRAAQMAGVHEVPAIVSDMDDRVAMEVALIENVQRADLNALEEAQGYQRLIDQFGYTQQQLAEIIGKSRSHVANTLRLLKLPQDVLEMIRDGQLSAGHARTLVATDDPSALAKKIVKLGMSVREAEKLSQTEGKGGEAGGKAQPRKEDAALASRALQQELEELLGLPVQIKANRNGSGRLVLQWQSLEQLDDICRRLRGQG